MEHIHKRFAAEQVKVLLKGYCQGILDRSAIEDVLGIGKTRFFALLKQYRQDPDGFPLTYERATPTRLSASIEEEIKKEPNTTSRCPRQSITIYLRRGWSSPSVRREQN